MTDLHDDAIRVLLAMCETASRARVVRTTLSNLSVDLGMEWGAVNLHIQDLMDAGYVVQEGWSWKVTDAGVALDFTERSESGRVSQSRVRARTRPRAVTRITPPVPDSAGSATTRHGDPSNYTRSRKGDRAENAQSSNEDAHPASISLGRIVRSKKTTATPYSLAMWFRSQCRKQAKTPRFGDVNVEALTSHISRWTQAGFTLDQIRAAMEVFLADRNWQGTPISAWKQLVSAWSDLTKRTSSAGAWDDVEGWD